MDAPSLQGCRNIGMGYRRHELTLELGTCALALRYFPYLKVILSYFTRLVGPLEQSNSIENTNRKWESLSLYSHL